MPTYAIYNATTEAVQWLAVQAAPPVVPAGLAFLTVPDGTSLGTTAWDVIDGALVAHAATFAQSQAAVLVQATAAYDALMAAGFTFQGILYQIDSASRANIASSALSAALSLVSATNYPWPSGFAWIASNNSLIPLTAAQMIAFARGVFEYVRQCRINLRAIKTAIAAAGTPAALTAVSVTAGYPTASA